MKILYTLNSGNYGGMEKHVLDLCEGMILKGHEVYVWCLDGPLKEEFKRLGVKITIKKIRIEVDPLYIFSLKSYLKNNKIDLIHAHELKPAVNSLIAAYLAGVKVRISHTHTPISEWQISELKKKINLIVYTWVVNRFATYEIALTDSRKRIKIKEGIKKEILKVISSPNCIRIEDFIYKEGEKELYRKEILARHKIPVTAKVIGCLGRISKEKGQPILVDAFSNYLEKISREKVENAYLLIIGGGPLEKVLEKRIAALGLENKIIITGKFVEEDKRKYYASLDYFVHPSLAEGFGLVLIEAMAAKIPVIASNLEVFKEVSGENVLYFERGVATDLAEKIYLLTATKKVKPKTEQAYQLVSEKYTFEKFTNSYETFYLELLGK